MHFNVNCVFSSKSLILLYIVVKDDFVYSANFFISRATILNPFPPSPALAASIEAFNERREVWSAISCIISIIFFISLTLFVSDCISSYIILILENEFIINLLLLCILLTNSWALSLLLLECSLIFWIVYDRVSDVAANSSLFETIDWIISLWLYAVLNIVSIESTCIIFLLILLTFNTESLS